MSADSCYSSTNVNFMSTRKQLIVPSSAISTFCSEIHAPRIPSMDCWALEMPFRMASSKDPGEVDVISITLATDTCRAPFNAEELDHRIHLRGIEWKLRGCPEPAPLRSTLTSRHGKCGTSDLSGVWRCKAVVGSAYGVVRQEHRLSGHRSGCGVVVVWWTVSPHYHVEDVSAGPRHCGYMDRGHRHGVYGDIGDVVTHCSLGAESYYVLRDTFHPFHTWHLTSIDRPRSYPKNRIPHVGDCS
jgi:hypothetical protein